MAAKDYAKAKENFQQALGIKKNAPETLIYLNNAKIGDAKSYRLLLCRLKMVKSQGDR